ncbi:MAG TPA: apolipoprotein N-acyltransferase [Acidobacteria bacterium]|nr:apolipoprotein N-acyltransferase [Acidobacteriota bacterium]
MRKIWLPLLALGGGALWGLCFSRSPLSVASWAVLAPLFLLLSARRAGLLAFLHGWAAWSVGLAWVAPTLITHGNLSPVVAWPLLGLLAAYLGAFHGVFGWLGAPLWRRFFLLRFVALPALWVSLEWLRGWLISGFPWNLAGYAWVDVPGALPLASWIGAYGISFLVILASLGVAASVQARRWEPVLACWLLPLLLLPMAARWSHRRTYAELEQALGPGGFGVAVRVIQPDIPILGGWDPAVIQANYRKMMRLSEQSCEPGALVVWPESAAWPFSYMEDPTFARDLHTQVETGGCTLLFNGSHPVEGASYNSAYLLSPGGGVQRYDKRHLVPFGEYVPYQGLFSWMDKLARNAGDFRPADGLTLLSWDDETIGMAICFEVVFPGEVAALTRAGSTLLVTISNDAWYGDTAAPWQHYRAARFRAAENRRPLLRAALTGVSGIIGPDGAVWEEFGVHQEGVLRARVRGLRGLTPYARAPWLVPLLCTLLAVVAVAGYPVSRR